MKNKKQKVGLKITLKNGSLMSWTVDRDEKRGLSYHYAYFYKWYFFREQSENYMFRSKTSEQLIKRSEILTFIVYIEGE